MVNSFWTFSILLVLLKTVTCSASILCGPTKSIELGGDVAGSALALVLVRQRRTSEDNALQLPCKLRISSMNATAFTIRIIDVKESFGDLDRQLAPDLFIASPVLNALTSASGQGTKKWGARSTSHAQETEEAEPVMNANRNKTDACTLSFFIGEAKQPMWKINLCGGNSASLAARAGIKLLPARLRVVWNPPASPYHHTEKLRLVITAVNSGEVCKEDTQFSCGFTGLCISTTLTCDSIWHCPAGEDEDMEYCAKRRDPPLIDLLRRIVVRNPEILGVNPSDDAVHNPTNIKVMVGEKERQTNTLQDISAALKPYGAWGYLVLGMLLCATCLMFCLAWECCCKSSKPANQQAAIPASCLDPSPTMLISVTQASGIATTPTSSPPAYEAPPSYSSLFPRAFKSSPTPVPHCSSQEQPPPD